MRVALDVTPLIGSGTGVATFARGAMAALAARDDVDLVAYGLTMTGRAALPGVVPAGVAVVRRPMPASLLLRMWRIAGLPPVEFWTGRVDVVHGTNFVVPPARRAAAVVTVHDLTSVRFPELCTSASLRYPDLIRGAIKRGAWVHTPSQAVADEVVDLLGAPPDRVRAIHSGLTPPRHDRIGVAARGRAAAKADRYILALGTVEPRKGLPTLVQAFDRLAGQRPDVDLVVAGPDGWGAEAFRGAVALARHGSRVRRIGWVDDATRSDLISGAAVLAVPSVYEGFGFPPLEAMALGVPVVATAAGALPEVLGDAAEIVPVGDLDALAAALLAVLEDDALASDLARRGRARAATFTWERWVTGITQLYRDAAGAQG